MEKRMCLCTELDDNSFGPLPVEADAVKSWNWAISAELVAASVPYVPERARTLVGRFCETVLRFARHTCLIHPLIGDVEGMTGVEFSRQIVGGRIVFQWPGYAGKEAGRYIELHSVFGSRHGVTNRGDWARLDDPLGFDPIVDLSVDPAAPDLIFFMTGVALYEWNVTTNAYATVKRFSGPYHNASFWCHLVATDGGRRLMLTEAAQFPTIFTRRSCTGWLEEKKQLITKDGKAA